MRVFFGVLLAIAMTAMSAQAQDAGEAATSTENAEPPTAEAQPTAKMSYDEFRKEELQFGIKRTRNALIATSASFAVGLALVIPAFTSKNCAQNEANTQFVCTTTGKALLGVGAPFLAVGFYGVLVSGIMLGVRKGKLRRLNERMAYESEAKLRWDPRRSSFVF